MRGDDDGFVGNPRKILRSTGCRDDDLRKLVEMGYVRIFESVNDFRDLCVGIIKIKARNED